MNTNIAEMHTEFIMLALIGMLFFIVINIRSIDSFWQLGPKSVINPILCKDLGESPWAKRLHSLKMSLMYMVMSFFIPLGVLNALGLMEYPFLINATKWISILFGIFVYGFTFCRVFNFKRLELCCYQLTLVLNAILFLRVFYVIIF